VYRQEVQQVALELRKPVKSVPKMRRILQTGIEVLYPLVLIRLCPFLRGEGEAPEPIDVLQRIGGQ
jgi:hypothetical protein